MIAYGPPFLPRGTVQRTARRQVGFRSLSLAAPRGMLSGRRLLTSSGGGRTGRGRELARRTDDRRTHRSLPRENGRARQARSRTRGRGGAALGMLIRDRDDVPFRSIVRLPLCSTVACASPVVFPRFGPRAAVHE